MTNWSEFIRGVVQRQPPGSNGRHPADWHIVVNRSVCLGCGACVAVCPPDALFLHNGYLAIDAGTCTRCERCVKMCPVHALSAAQEPS